MQKNGICSKKICEIVFLVVFPVQNLIFGHFWNCKKWNFVKTFFREIDLFDFTSFFGMDFFKFSGTLWSHRAAFLGNKEHSFGKGQRMALTPRETTAFYTRCTTYTQTYFLEVVWFSWRDFLSIIQQCSTHFCLGNNKKVFIIIRVEWFFFYLTIWWKMLRYTAKGQSFWPLGLFKATRPKKAKQGQKKSMAQNA